MTWDWALLESKLDGLEPPRRIALYTVAGTWARPDQGFQADIARLVDDEKFRWHPVDYPAGFGPVGGNNPSYADSVQIGRANVTDWINRTPGRFALCGHSQGAEVVGWICKDLTEGSLRHRLGDCVGSVTTGDPCRQKTDITYGTGTSGWGISRLVIPQGVKRVTFSLTGDMYCTTPDGQAGDNMHACYRALTQLGSDPVQLLQAAISGDNDLLEQLAEIIGRPLSGGVSLIASLIALARFGVTRAHDGYGPFVGQAAAELNKMT